MQSRVLVSEMRQDDLGFLLLLWAIPQVMRYADEFPAYRGWTKSEPAETAWEKYIARRDDLGPGYTQLILKLEDGTRIGESFFAPLPEGYTFGPWSKPAGVPSLMGDIKLLPQHWGQGLGTEGMCKVVEWLCTHTSCELIVVPPHRRNPAAERVYEKAGFVLVPEMASSRGHRIMVLTRS